MEDLLAVMEALRDGEHGCAWDRVQTFSSIAPYTIEEAYEVADAIARDDMAALCDELGDLLLQVVYHAQMARERESFVLSDVVATIVDKMVRRHPHVFGDTVISSSEEQSRLWAEIKAQERGVASGARQSSLLDEVQRGLPPLLQGVALQRVAGRVGFDWTEARPIIAKIREELGELEDAVASGSSKAMSEEIGDLLFAVVNLARRLDVNPEMALIAANAKFRRRFARIEALLLQAGSSTEEATLEEMERLWNVAKREENPGD
ncbi:MAG: nucleoside triphosphate pyrophosphohydrolase [Pseudomonadota bacterium]|nr:nucleoside triphosphate pyrophosphohydrolase [Pseudomonadota bacterium]